jgi:hypothetical protein
MRLASARACGPSGPIRAHPALDGAAPWQLRVAQIRVFYWVGSRRAADRSPVESNMGIRLGYDLFRFKEAVS